MSFKELVLKDPLQAFCEFVTALEILTEDSSFKALRWDEKQEQFKIRKLQRPRPDEIVVNAKGACDLLHRLFENYGNKNILSTTLEGISLLLVLEKGGYEGAGYEMYYIVAFMDKDKNELAYLKLNAQYNSYDSPWWEGAEVVRPVERTIIDYVPV